jgi:hypothetical protein
LQVPGGRSRHEGRWRAEAELRYKTPHTPTTTTGVDAADGAAPPEPSVRRIRASVSRPQAILNGLLCLIVLATLVTASAFAFEAFGASYFEWYVDNGALIAIVFAFFSLAWGGAIQAETGLISVNPVHYSATCLALLVLPSAAMAAALGTGARRSEEARIARAALVDEADWAAQMTVSSSTADFLLLFERNRARLRAIEERRSALPASTFFRIPASAGFPDFVLAALVMYAVMAALLVWVVVVAPLQYFVFLITAAPARMATASPYLSYAHSLGTNRQRRDVGFDHPKTNPLPEAATESGFSASPVTLTFGVTAGALFLVSQLVA